MKKNLLAGLLLLWACSVYGQKRIVDPVRSDFSYVAKFDRVEITGKRTVAEVRARGCQDLVRFFALLRIKPHAPPLVRVPVNSFEFHSCERTPQVEYLMRLLRHRSTFVPRHLVFIVYGVDYQGI